MRYYRIVKFLYVLALIACAIIFLGAVAQLYLIFFK